MSGDGFPFEYTVAAYRAAGYERMTDVERAAWDTTHEALIVADGERRFAEGRVDRARARSRTTPAHLEKVLATMSDAGSRFCARYDELLEIERIANERVAEARASRFVDVILEDGTIDGVSIVRPVDQEA